MDKKPLKISLFELVKQDLPLQCGNLLVKLVELKPVFEGKAEVHFRFSDIYAVIQGEATVITSEKFENGIEVEKGEYRNITILEPIEHVLKKGDIFMIPPGVAHKLVVRETLFVQWVIKVPSLAVQ